MKQKVKIMNKNKLQYRKKQKQTEFLFSQQIRKQNRKFAKGFGGELLTGKRKEKRPLSDKKPMHLILRSDTVKVFKPTNKQLRNFIYKIADKYGIKIYELALNHNHIHFVMKLKNKARYNSFIRELTSKIALTVRRFFKYISASQSKQNAEDSSDLKSILSHRPFSRILDWGRDFQNCIGYVLLNIDESLGYIKRTKQLSQGLRVRNAH